MLEAPKTRRSAASRVRSLEAAAELFLERSYASVTMADVAARAADRARRVRTRMRVVSERRYWFPAKRYGWGWGLPSTWEGWLVLAAYALVVAAAVAVSRDDPVALLPLMTIASVAFVGVCWWKGEPPRWRWGRPRDR